MNTHDFWTLSLSGIVLASVLACFPEGHSDIPDKAEVIPKLSMTIPVSTPVEEQPSACELEVEQLQDELRDLRHQNNNYGE